MEHYPTVFYGITWGSRVQFPYKTILYHQMIIGIGSVVVQVAITFIKIALIVVIAHFYDTIFHPKGVAIIVPNFIMVNFSGPILNILSIEHGYQTVVFFFRNGLYRTALAKK